MEGNYRRPWQDIDVSRVWMMGRKTPHPTWPYATPGLGLFKLVRTTLGEALRKVRNSITDTVLSGEAEERSRLAVLGRF